MEHDGPQLEHGGPRSMFRFVVRRGLSVVRCVPAVVRGVPAVVRWVPAVVRCVPALVRRVPAVVRRAPARERRNPSLLVAGRVRFRRCPPQFWVCYGYALIVDLFSLRCSSLGLVRRGLLSVPALVPPRPWLAAFRLWSWSSPVVAPSFAWPRLSHGRRVRVRDFVVFF